MGVSRSPAELAAKLEVFGKVHLSAARRDGVGKGALLITTSVRRELGRVMPSGRLSGVGKRGARVSVGFDAPRSLSAPVALVRMKGPAHLIESDTSPRTIRPRRRSRGGPARRALAIPGVGLRASVQHPGTRGKHPWRRGVQASRHLVLPTIQAEVHSAMVKAFR